MHSSVQPPLDAAAVHHQAAFGPDQAPEQVPQDGGQDSAAANDLDTAILSTVAAAGVPFERTIDVALALKGQDHPARWYPETGTFNRAELRTQLQGVMDESTCDAFLDHEALGILVHFLAQPQAVLQIVMPDQRTLDLGAHLSPVIRQFPECLIYQMAIAGDAGEVIDATGVPVPGDGYSLGLTLTNNSPTPVTVFLPFGQFAALAAQETQTLWIQAPYLTPNELGAQEVMRLEHQHAVQDVQDVQPVEGGLHQIQESIELTSKAARLVAGKIPAGIVGDQLKKLLNALADVQIGTWIFRDSSPSRQQWVRIFSLAEKVLHRGLTIDTRRKKCRLQRHRVDATHEAHTTAAKTCLSPKASALLRKEISPKVDDPEVAIRMLNALAEQPNTHIAYDSMMQITEVGNADALCAARAVLNRLLIEGATILRGTQMRNKSFLLQVTEETIRSAQEKPRAVEAEVPRRIKPKSRSVHLEAITVPKRGKGRHPPRHEPPPALTPAGRELAVKPIADGFEGSVVTLLINELAAVGEGKPVALSGEMSHRGQLTRLRGKVNGVLKEGLEVLNNSTTFWWRRKAGPAGEGDTATPSPEPSPAALALMKPKYRRLTMEGPVRKLAVGLLNVMAAKPNQEISYRDMRSQVISSEWFRLDTSWNSLQSMLADGNTAHRGPGATHRSFILNTSDAAMSTQADAGAFDGDSEIEDLGEALDDEFGAGPDEAATPESSEAESLRGPEEADDPPPAPRASQNKRRAETPPLEQPPAQRPALQRHAQQPPAAWMEETVLGLSRTVFSVYSGGESDAGRVLVSRVDLGFEPVPGADNMFPLREPGHADSVLARYAGPDGRCAPGVRVQGASYLPYQRDHVAKMLREDGVSEGRLDAALNSLTQAVSAEMQRLIEADRQSDAERASDPRHVPRMLVRRLQPHELQPHEQALAGQYGLFLADARTWSQRLTAAKGQILGIYAGEKFESESQYRRFEKSHGPLSHRYDMGVGGGALVAPQGFVNSIAFANTALLPGSSLEGELAYDDKRINAFFTGWQIALSDDSGKRHLENIAVLLGHRCLYDRQSNPHGMVLADYGPRYRMEHEPHPPAASGACARVKTEPMDT